MDPQAYLMSQGWSGPGNPLNPSRRPGPHGGLGLTKPILVARKKNTHGVGKKTTHDHTNQWWLRGFEAALRGIGTDGNATPTSEESTAATPMSELYKFFVRGPGLEGTIKPRESSENQQSSISGCMTPTSSAENSVSNQKKKRKREETEGPTMDSKKKMKKKKNKKVKVSVDEHVDMSSNQISSGIATPPEEETTMDGIIPSTKSAKSPKPTQPDEELSEKKRKRKEAKRGRKRRKEGSLETETSTPSDQETKDGSPDDMSSDEASRKRKKEIKRAAKKAQREESGERKKSKKSKKNKVKSDE
ncbi:uncharacterized protein GIQ15_00785 [Arthroderma uncinatum]|uniref:uncharacterized protein n=1 Tax=Arthroderma uncinatum TaxID=74035 RepID=UPI00144AF5A8|nr:uncharacterized protein GIQ15_00785 [Arthroderma uncinatum]KAF3491268.1 hypothetical protein GIQ15_00785 [Arthroderma uncinatum]